MIWRARKSRRLVARMSGILERRTTPGNLVSFKGLRWLFWSDIDPKTEGIFQSLGRPGED